MGVRRQRNACTGTGAPGSSGRAKAPRMEAGSTLTSGLARAVPDPALATNPAVAEEPLPAAERPCHVLRSSDVQPTLVLRTRPTIPIAHRTSPPKRSPE